MDVSGQEKLAGVDPLAPQIGGELVAKRLADVDPRAPEVGNQPAAGRPFPVGDQPRQPAAVELLAA
jgi:hypothetical protein